jgi:xylan 1,4-beta-xylosidase
MSFLAYLTQVRLNHAVSLLLTTEKIIEEVSADSGFPNSHAFVQAFKKEYGVLPSVYRRQNREKTPVRPAVLTVEQHDYMAGLKKYLQTSQELVTASVNAISCNIRLQANADSGKLRHTWRKVMAVGSASDLLTADVQKLVARMRREIGFQYIKFNGILSDDMHVYNMDSQGNPVYNFAYMDKVFDFLLSIGLLVGRSYSPFLYFNF